VSGGAQRAGLQRLEATVSGLVQGVGFRYATVREARALGGLTGHVRNSEDGTVEVVAEGDYATLQRLERWLSHGPEGAVVRRVQARYSAATGKLQSFGVAY
jgi:acylphosphatase